MQPRGIWLLTFCLGKGNQGVSGSLHADLYTATKSYWKTETAVTES